MVPVDSAVAADLVPRASADAAAIQVRGKFFFAGDAKFFVKGVTYGPFGPGSHGTQFPEREIVARDFALMRELGANMARVFTVPPLWLLDMAAEAGLRILVGIPWAQHVTFLDDAAIQRDIMRTVVEAVRGLHQHRAIFAYLVGNEIPPDMVRWHGPERVRDFLKRLVGMVREVDPERLVSYANFPSTEYLTVDFTDFLCFNVYLHDEAPFRRYLSRLHNLAVDRPLVLTEFGVDSMREGDAEQARILSWQIRTAFAMGVAGTFVFAWTDEWFTGGHAIEDWAFGVVDRQREKKPAFAAVKERYLGPLPPRLSRFPRVSVVVCAYNAERTMEDCLASLEHLNYPDYEVIVVNDGSKDRTLEITERFGYCRIISQPNKGLSVARNVGAEAATGEIVAYTDSDCVADPDWLAYLVAKMESAEPRRLRRPQFPAARGQSRAGGGGGVAGRPDARAAERRRGRAHRRLQHGVPPRRAAQSRRLRSGLSRRRRRCRYLLAAAGCGPHDRLQPGSGRLAFPPQHGRRLYRPAARLRQGRGARLFEASFPLQSVRPGEVARAHLWRSLDRALAVAPAAHLFGRLRPRAFPDALRAVLLARGVPAAHLRVERGGDRAGLGRHHRRRLDVAHDRAAAHHLGDLRQRRAQGADRQALPRHQGARAGGAPHLSRPHSARLRAPQMALEGDARARDHRRPRPGDPEAASRAAGARLLSLLLERDGRQQGSAVGRAHALPHPAEIFRRGGPGLGRVGLKIARGLWSRALVLVCTENHGEGKRLLRVRCAMRLSRFAALVLRAYAVATAVALILDAPALGAVVGIIGLAHGGFIALRTIEFGRLMHRIIETVAQRQDLVPLLPSGGAPQRAPAPGAV